jgi:hypothetical protein
MGRLLSRSWEGGHLRDLIVLAGLLIRSRGLRVFVSFTTLQGWDFGYYPGLRISSFRCGHYIPKSGTGRSVVLEGSTVSGGPFSFGLYRIGLFERPLLILPVCLKYTLGFRYRASGESRDPGDAFLGLLYRLSVRLMSNGCRSSAGIVFVGRMVGIGVSVGVYYCYLRRIIRPSFSSSVPFRPVYCCPGTEQRVD